MLSQKVYRILSQAVDGEFGVWVVFKRKTIALYHLNMP